MQAELNKYFPTDITNLILKMHYKAIFQRSLGFMMNEMDWIRHIFDPDESESYFIKHFHNKMFYIYENRFNNENLNY
jgi:hypothetical protein